MEIRPDNRHLVGGTVVFLLATAWIVYNGITQPGRAYYQPEFSIHSGQQYELQCTDCHTAPFQPATNEGCIFCHPGGAREKPKVIPKNLPPGAKPPEQILQSHAAAALHKLVAAQSCNDCHIEHAHSELGDFLKAIAPERRQSPRYPDNVHKFIPENAQGEQNCAKCHMPEELEVRDEVVAMNGN